MVRLRIEMSMYTHHLCCGLFDKEEVFDREKDIYCECKGPLCQRDLLSFALLERAHVHVHVYTCMSGQW